MTVVDVAVGVLLDDEGRFLLAQRSLGKAYPGYWEFPGGKIEDGESALGALIREFDEELGICVAAADPWLTRTWSYPQADVRLRFFRIRTWHGELRAHEHQALAWQVAHSIDVAPLLPANHAVLAALALPETYAITPDGCAREAEFLSALEQALVCGARLIQLRDKTSPPKAFARFATDAVALCRRHGARVVINRDAALAWKLGADGVHLTSEQLMRTVARPSLTLCGASCHDGLELAHAEQLETDFVVLGAVSPTPGHPGVAPLGWERFGQLIVDYSLPVFAIGGIRNSDLAVAQSHGAHGIAMIRGAWSRHLGNRSGRPGSG